MRAIDFYYWPIVGKTASYFRWFRKRCGGYWAKIRDNRPNFSAIPYWHRLELGYPEALKSEHVWFIDILDEEDWR